MIFRLPRRHFPGWFVKSCVLVIAASNSGITDARAQSEPTSSQGIISKIQRRWYLRDGVAAYAPDDPWQQGKSFLNQTGHLGFFYNCDNEECKRFSPYIRWQSPNCPPPGQPLGLWDRFKRDIHRAKQRIADGSCAATDRPISAGGGCATGNCGCAGGSCLTADQHLLAETDQRPPAPETIIESAPIEENASASDGVAMLPTVAAPPNDFAALPPQRKTGPLVLLHDQEKIVPTPARPTSPESMPETKTAIATHSYQQPPREPSRSIRQTTPTTKGFAKPSSRSAGLIGLDTKIR